MEELGAIVSVDEVTDWCSGMVKVYMKNNKVHIPVQP